MKIENKNREKERANISHHRFFFRIKLNHFPLHAFVMLPAYGTPL